MTSHDMTLSATTLAPSVVFDPSEQNYCRLFSLSEVYNTYTHSIKLLLNFHPSMLRAGYLLASRWSVEDRKPRGHERGNIGVGFLSSSIPGIIYLGFFRRPIYAHGQRSAIDINCDNGRSA
jgi:hypothetical protein